MSIEPKQKSDLLKVFGYFLNTAFFNRFFFIASPVLQTTVLLGSPVCVALPLIWFPRGISASRERERRSWRMIRKPHLPNYYLTLIVPVMLKRVGKEILCTAKGMAKCLRRTNIWIEREAECELKSCWKTGTDKLRSVWMESAACFKPTLDVIR